MTTFDYSEVELIKLITHHIGNKHNEDGFTFSDGLSNIVQNETREYLIEYFLSQFKAFEVFNFTHSVGLEMNEVYTLSKKMFSDPDTFIPESKNLAKLLYENSIHPNIKQGELNIVYFDHLVIGDEIVDAIGIFKSETDVPFIKMNGNKENYNIEHQFGFDLKGIDKACLIFNTDEESGYNVLIIDNASRATEARYWMNDFLQLTPSNDGYHNTKDFLNITKDFVTKQLPEEYEFSKTDKIDLLNRSIDYFKSNESFDKEEFEQDVFQDEEVIESFRQFDNNFRLEHKVEVEDKFDISEQAVKKQSRVFKSVLKLDKNFHVYIHGDKSLIEKGTDANGRKFYKIYYEEEA